MKKRILSSLLAMLMLVSLLPMQVFAAEGEVTRIQWLQKLTETFDMTVEADNYPDNYYSDVSSDDSYYRDVMVATEFGLIDQEPGTELKPNEPATREFAAHTLNFCLGYELEEGTTYTFTDSAALTYADDAQIAVNRNWFALVDGKFMPEQAITNGEMTAMIADAAEVLADSEIDEGHDNVFTFKDGIKVIPQGTPVQQNEDGSITFTGNIAIEKGDVVAVFLRDIPSGYTVEMVTASNGVTTFTGTETSLGDYIESIDAQGSSEGDYLDFVPTEGATVTYIFNDGTQTRSRARAAARGSNAIKDINVTIPASIGKANASLTVSMTNAKIDWKVDLKRPAVNSYAMAQLKANITTTFTGKMKVGETLVIGQWRIPGLGSISITGAVSCEGKIVITERGNLAAGFEFSGGRFRDIRNYKATSFTTDTTVSGVISVTAAAEINVVDKLIAGISASAGVQAEYRRTDRTPETPARCENIRAWLFVKYDIYANIPGLDPYRNTVYIFNERNSPAKINFHYEDGKQVAKCTYGDYGDYYTCGDSHYGYGCSGFGSSTGLNSAGEPYTIFEYSLDEDNNATITKYYGNVAAISVPETLDGYTVIAIGNDVFKGRAELRSVVIPSTITKINGGAFYGCSNLSNLVLQDGLKTIKGQAFAKCVSLTTLELPDTVTVVEGGAFGKCSNLSNVKLSKNLEQLDAHAFFDCDRITSIQIPKTLIKSNSSYIYEFVYDYQDGAFYGCDGLKNIEFEDGMTAIPNGLFANCPGIESLVIPDSVTKIGDNAFGKCVNLKDVKLSENLNELGCKAFSYCSSLETIKIPDSVTVIYSGVFGQCTSLSNVELSKNLKRMDAHAFFNCDALSSIKIPKSLETSSNAYLNEFAYDYQDGAFYGCDGLKTIEFEEGATAIPGGLFANCPGLESIELPYTITKIGQGAFYNSKNLTSVKLSESLTTICHKAFASCVKLEAIEMPDSVVKVESGAFAKCSSLASVKLSKALTQMDAHAFFDCDALTAIEIPKSLTKSDRAYIYEYAYDYQNGPFYGCDGLKDVTFEKGTSVIPEGLFAHCPGLESVVVPNTVTKLGWEAFYDCKNLKTVELKDGLQQIDTSAFNNCTSLAEISIPDTVSSMGTYVFERCSSLKMAKLPNIRDRIMAYTFENCTSLEKIVLPDTVTEIQDHAFKNCTSLKDITWSKSINTIKDYAFENCDAITEVKLSNSVTYIGAGVFYDCDGITSVSIPDSVTSVGVKLFYDCDALTDVKLGTGITTIPENTFNHCDALENIVIPRRVTTIGNYVFKDCVKFTEITIPRAVTSISANAFSYPAKMTIYGVAGTYAETFANDNSIKFVDRQINATSATLDKTMLTLNKGSNTKLYLSVQPVDFTDEVNWKSADTSVVTVAADGTVKAVGVGTTTIKVTVGNASTSCKVTVVQPVTSISLNKTSLSMEALSTYQLTATAYPNDAYDKSVKWESSDNSVATVSENGLVTAVGKGTATIKATSTAVSSVSRSCTVTVTNNGIVAKDVAQLESPHNYGNNCSDVWLYTLPGASKITATFDERTNIEDGFDYLYIYNAKGEQVGKYTGTELAGKSIDIDGDTVKIKLVSDGGGNEWGFKVTDVKVASGAHVHSYTSIVTAPTCTEKGYTTHTCACGDSYVDSYTDALGHSYGTWKQTKAPTCTAKGTEARTCTRCNASETRGVNALGHDLKHHAAKAATCTEKGWAAYDTCSRCNYTTYKEIPSLGHSYANGKCTRCGAADPNYKPAPKSPELKITTSAGKPKIYWNAVDGAVKYWVYRSTDGKNFKYYDSTKKTNYTNSSTSIGTTYYYKVKAVAVVDGKDYASDYSVIRSILCKPAAPSVSINRSNGKPKLSWKAVSGATK
ncbi:MAG: leucine-rich repeat protein, partial [Oscillospiraceae bacterium]